MKNKTLFFIPTYNEIKNLEQVFKEIGQLNLDADVLFMDDNSPDGTAAKIEELRKKNDNIYLGYVDSIYFNENNNSINIKNDLNQTIVSELENEILNNISQNIEIITNDNLLNTLTINR